MDRARADAKAAAARKQASKAEKKHRRVNKVADAAIANGDAFAAWEADPDVPIDTLLGCYAHSDELVSIEALYVEMLDDLVVLAASDEPEPNTIREALASDEADLWRVALQEEFDAIQKMGVYKLIPRAVVPAGRRILKGKPVFKRKRDADGKICRYKARWVAKGFLQVFGVDFDKTTSPTARLETIRVLFHICASLDLDLRQFDVKSAFLHGKLTDPLFMEQPTGFEEEGKPAKDFVWMLMKGLYGIKQGGRVWNDEMNGAMGDWAFHRVNVEYCLYCRQTQAGFILVAVHVDDFLSVASSTAINDEFENQLRSRWEITKSDGSHILGIHVIRDRKRRHIHLSQTAAIDKVAKEFGQLDARAVSTPMDPNVKLSRAQEPISEEEKREMSKLRYRELVGSLVYFACATRPDIAYAVTKVSAFVNNPGKAHYDAAVRILRYLKHTRLYVLTLGAGTDYTGRVSQANSVRLVGMTDSDFAGCLDTRRSVSGYCFALGSGAVSWSSRKQDIVTTSTTEAEYVAAFNATKEAVWLRQVLREIGFAQDQPTIIGADNQGAITLSEQQCHHQRTKHIDVDYHYTRERITRRDITLNYVRSHDNVADIFTKPLGTTSFVRLRKRLGVSLPSEEEEEIAGEE